MVVGGGGGQNGGGGGGAGAYTTNTNYPIAANTTYAVTVGNLGAAATSGSVQGSDGGASVFGTGTVITSTGGGGGASRDGGGGGRTGGSGGGGGGGSASPQWNAGVAGGSGTSKNNGGGSYTTDKGCWAIGGGGGGAGAVGGAGTTNSSNSSVAGTGGVGLSNSISGTATFYAGGGGGGWTGFAACCCSMTAAMLTGGAGGNGGGGSGESSVGSANTGGGGGAERDGGTGIVIVRYADVLVGTWVSSNTAVATVSSAAGSISGNVNTVTINPVACGSTTISYTYGTGTPCSASPTTNTIAITITGTTPTITVQPVAPSAFCSGAGSQNISVTATSATSYQWRKGGVNLSNGGTFSGVTGATLTIANPAVTDAGSYDCVVSNQCSVVSSAVAVTVNATPTTPPAITGTTSIACSATSTLTAPAPTGGTISYSGGKRIHTFLLAQSGTNFTTPLGFTPGTVEVLVVAGGGGGGGFGGGGGAGGLVYNVALAVAANTPYTVTVGDGGNGGAYNTVGGNGLNGGNSIFSSITANGGGGGGTRVCGSPCYGVAGNAGGSGGGGSPADGTTKGAGGAASPAGQGNVGGTEGASFGWGGSGGGGAGAVGASGNGNVAGAGGDGLAYSISGGSLTYAGGGGGCVYNAGSGLSAAAGGSGGGGAGGTNTTGVAGTSNTGGGGGGGDAGYSGGKGGSGIVIISYPDITNGTWTSSVPGIAQVTSQTNSSSPATDLGSTALITGLTAGTSIISYSYTSATGCASVSAQVNPFTVGGCSTITLASNTISAACKVPSTLKVPIQSFSGAITVGTGNLTNVQFTTTGSYAQADITKYQLWYSSSNTFPGTATQVGADLLTAGGGAGTRSFAAFTTPTLTSGTTYYFWITIDVAAAPTNGNTIACNATVTGDLTYVGTKSGSTTAGGIQTLQAIPAAPTSMKSH